MAKNGYTHNQYSREPSPKVKKAFELTLKNSVNPTMTKGEILEKAGYPASVQSNPQTVERTKSWQMLREKYLSKDLLTKTHNKLVKSENENIQIKAVDMGYKLHNQYQEDTLGNDKVMSITNILNVFQNTPDISDAD